MKGYNIHLSSKSAFWILCWQIQCRYFEKLLLLKQFYFADFPVQDMLTESGWKTTRYHLSLVPRLLANIVTAPYRTAQNIILFTLSFYHQTSVS
jgi:hypothetical protein